MNKTYVIPLALLTLVLTGCGTQSRVLSPPAIPTTPTPTPVTAAPTPSSATPVTINLIAKQFEWVPSTVRVPFGAHVKLVIKSEDVTHGIAIREFNVRQDIPVGETVNVEFDATTRGEFAIFCSVFCGEGHRDMRGKLVVE